MNDPNAPKGSEEKKFQVNQVSKSRYRRSCNTSVDDVTKYGQLMAINRRKISVIKREFDPNLKPGTEEVVQKGENGKTTTHQLRKIH